MTVIGAYEFDIERSLWGDEGAIERVTFGYYFWPSFVKWLKRAELLEETDPLNRLPEVRGPVSNRDLAAVMVRRLYGESEPEVSFVEARVSMLKQAIGSLGDLEELLTVELKEATAIAERL